MVMAEKIIGFPRRRAAFNLLPGTIVLPHYNELPAVMIRMARMMVGRGLVLVGIEGNTALVRDGDRYEVFGSGGVTVWDRTGKTRHTRGPIDRFP
jgi:cyanophycinase-like exopeptidase